MNYKKTLILQLLKFLALTLVGSFIILSILSFILRYQPADTRTIITIIVHLSLAIYLHYKLDNKKSFLANSIVTPKYSISRMRSLYLMMAIIFTVVTYLVSMVLYLLIDYSAAIGSICAFLYSLYSVMNYSDSTFSSNNQNNQQQRQRISSVIHTGDIDDYPTYTSHGSAHWISDRMKNAYTDNVNGEPTYKGLWIGGGFFHHKEGNLLSIAPPGTGKGAALIIPNLLWKRDYPHSFVVFDPKGTNACITARFQRQQGKKVIIIDPMNLQAANKAKHGIRSSHFNPLDYIKHDIFNGTAQIANLLIPDDPNGEKFWNQDARNLVQAVLMHIMTDEFYEGERNLVTLYKLMLTASFTTLLADMSKNMAVQGTISDIAKGFAEVLYSTEQTFSSIRTVANASIKWLSNPALQNCMQKSDFHPDDLEKGNIALYICQPIQNKEGFATFSRLIIGFCLRANSKPTAKPKAWVYYLLDEFPTMGVFPEVIESLAFSREYKMRIWLFCQSLSQLDTIYKVEGRNQITGNVRVLQAFGVTDHVTQEYISKRTGSKTNKVVTSSHSHGTGTNRSDTWTKEYGYQSSTNTSQNYSHSESFHAQPLISPEMVQYDPHIITISEWGPLRLYRWQYWQNDQNAGDYPLIFADGRADRNPNIEPVSDDEEDEYFVEEIFGPKGEGQFYAEFIKRR